MATEDNTRPRAYDLKRPSELRRLLRECRGYITTCKRHHHGTDFEGRDFAIDALDELTTDKWLVTANARINS